MAKIKHILLVTSEFPPGPGGIGNHSYNLAKQLSHNGFNISVIAPNDKDFALKFDESQNFNIYRYKNGSYVRLISILLLMLRESLIDSKQIVIASGQIPLVLTCILGNIVFNKTLAVFHGHEFSLGNQLIKFLLKIFIGRFDKIISVSEFSKKRALMVKPNLKIKVVNNGFDINRFKTVSQFNKDFDGLKLITLGSLSYRKGQHNVIKALPYIQKHYNNIEYGMIGTPYIIEDLKKLAQSLNVEHLVKFYGSLNDDDVNKLLLKSDIFLMLSESTKSGDVEGYGIAILEANYLGLPAIGSIGCGIEDAITIGYNGQLIRYDNPQDLLLAINSIYKNYEQYSKNSVKWAKKHSWDIISNYYLKEIKSIA